MHIKNNIKNASIIATELATGKKHMDPNENIIDILEAKSMMEKKSDADRTISKINDLEQKALHDIHVMKVLSRYASTMIAILDTHRDEYLGAETQLKTNLEIEYAQARTVGKARQRTKPLQTILSTLSSQLHLIKCTPNSHIFNLYVPNFENSSFQCRLFTLDFSIHNNKFNLPSSIAYEFFHNFRYNPSTLLMLLRVKSHTEEMLLSMGNNIKALTSAVNTMNDYRNYLINQIPLLEEQYHQKSSINISDTALKMVKATKKIDSASFVYNHQSSMIKDLLFTILNNH